MRFPRLKERSAISTLVVIVISMIIGVAIVSGLYLVVASSTHHPLSTSTLNCFCATSGTTTNATTTTRVAYGATNIVTDNFENATRTFLIWSNNSAVENPISSIAITTDNTVSCQIIQFSVIPTSYVFIRPNVVVNNNGSFFGLTYANGTHVSYLVNPLQDYYYTNQPVYGSLYITFTLAGHGSCS